MEIHIDVDRLPDGKLKTILKRIILIGTILTVLGVVGFFGITMFIAKNATVEVKKPAVKPTALVEEPVDTTSIPTENETPKAIEISTEDTKTCALIKSTLYAAFFKYKLYTEAVLLMKDGYCIFEIKPAGVTTAGIQLKAILAKSLSSLTAPTTTGTDTYYALVLKGNKNIKDYNDLIYVIPGVSGTVPTKEEFSVPETVTNLISGNTGTGNTTTGNTESGNTTGNTGIGHTIGDIHEKRDPFIEKKAIQTDATTCIAIESCVNSALSNEAVYKETALLIKNGPVIFEIKTTPKLSTTAGKLMNIELLTSLDELIAPKQPGKDTYYVYIEGKVSGSMISVGEVKVITGKTGVTPTAKDFGTSSK